MTSRPWFGFLATSLILAACQPTGGLQRLEGPYAPGIAPGEAEDGLIVGHRLMAAGEYQLALDAYIRAAAQHGLNVDTLSAMGSANLRLGRLGQSERLLRKAVEIDPKFVPAWNNLGVVLMEQGKTGEAVETFKRAFALDSGGDAQIRENLKLAMARMKGPGYAESDNKFALMRRGEGSYLLLSH